MERKVLQGGEPAADQLFRREGGYRYRNVRQRLFAFPRRDDDLFQCGCLLRAGLRSRAPGNGAHGHGQGNRKCPMKSVHVVPPLKDLAAAEYLPIRPLGIRHRTLAGFVRTENSSKCRLVQPLVCARPGSSGWSRRNTTLGGFSVTQDLFHQRQAVEYRPFARHAPAGQPPVADAHEEQRCARRRQLLELPRVLRRRGPARRECPAAAAGLQPGMIDAEP
ncbi:MAG: hypothetical protein F4002_08515 [Chromatiales bacterium]|nr:hypothetical protein [Chromatiales bacterium]